MSGNCKGSYQTTKENMMAAYDKLPPTARLAFQNAVENWVPQPALTRWKRGTPGWKTGKDIAAKVAQWDAAELKRRARKRR